MEPTSFAHVCLSPQWGELCSSNVALTVKQLYHIYIYIYIYCRSRQSNYVSKVWTEEDRKGSYGMEPQRMVGRSAHRGHKWFFWNLKWQMGHYDPQVHRNGAIWDRSEVEHPCHFTIRTKKIITASVSCFNVLYIFVYDLQNCWKLTVPFIYFMLGKGKHSFRPVN